MAFIPGMSQSGAFVQMISPQGSRWFDVPSVSEKKGVITAGDCRFSASGCTIRLPGVWGEISYGRLTPLSYDIMGPFKWLPMECRHGVISMSHSLKGQICENGSVYDFDGGQGYIEKDSGRSFPQSYLWLQWGDLPSACSIMASVATIPMGLVSFTGCICAVMHHGVEYRLATYKGVRILDWGSRHLKLSQGRLRLEIDISPHCGGHPLSSPVNGHMSGRVRESLSAHIHARMWEKGKLVFDFESPLAAYEYTAPKGTQDRP